jgi:hypothetical protein
MSAGEAATFRALGPRGLVMVRASLSRAKVKEGLAVELQFIEHDSLKCEFIAECRGARVRRRSSAW